MVGFRSSKLEHPRMSLELNRVDFGSQSTSNNSAKTVSRWCVSGSRSSRQLLPDSGGSSPAEHSSTAFSVLGRVTASRIQVRTRVRARFLQQSSPQLAADRANRIFPPWTLLLH